MKTAVLLMAYGGPDSLADVPAYLSDVRNGRETPQALVDEITHRYRLIGGRSPLLAITRSVAARLQTELGMPVYVGMRHWHPYIRQAVLELAADGIQCCVAIVMAPHYSRMSIGAYRQKLEQALADTGAPIAVSMVESWGMQPEYLAGLAENVRAAWRRFAPEMRDDVQFVFTAHSLPAAIVARGDPYQAQLQQTSAELAEMLGLREDRWQFCYQSAPKTDIPWLGPQVEEVIPELARAGNREVVVAPIGFIADHVEVLYDLDIGLQEIAESHDVHLERPAMLNDSPVLVAALAALVRAHLPPASAGDGRGGEGALIHDV
jgi:ferrochelatase